MKNLDNMFKNVNGDPVNYILIPLFMFIVSGYDLICKISLSKKLKIDLKLFSLKNEKRISDFSWILLIALILYHILDLFFKSQIMLLENNHIRLIVHIFVSGFIIILIYLKYKISGKCYILLGIILIIVFNNAFELLETSNKFSMITSQSMLLCTIVPFIMIIAYYYYKFKEELKDKPYNGMFKFCYDYWESFSLFFIISFLSNIISYFLSGIVLLLCVIVIILFFMSICFDPIRIIKKYLYVYRIDKSNYIVINKESGYGIKCIIKDNKLLIKKKESISHLSASNYKVIDIRKMEITINGI